MIDHNPEVPKYIFVSHVTSESENMADVKFRWVDPKSKKLYKGGNEI
jgi:hypothetical protein